MSSIRPHRPLWALFYALLTLSSYSYANAESIKIINRNGRTTVTAPTSGSSMINVQSNGGNFSLSLATGKAAEILSQPEPAPPPPPAPVAPPRPAPPPKPLGPTKPMELRSIPIYEKETLLGGITEVSPGSGTYLAARHLFLNHDQGGAAIRASFAKSKLNIADYMFFEFKNSGTLIDAVLIVPKRDVAKYLNVQNSKDCNCDAKNTYKLNSRINLKKSPKLNDMFHSQGYGSTGSKSIEQQVSGRINRIGWNEFYLDLNSDNPSTVRSSGSIVQVAEAPAVSAGNANAWSIGGVMECIYKDKFIDGIKIPGSLRVIGGQSLLNADVVSTNIEALSAEPTPVPSDDCTPIDWRAGGGN